MHPYFVYELYRQNLARWEREAELARIFKEGMPERERRRRPHIGFSVPRLRRQARTVARGTC